MRDDVARVMSLVIALALLYYIGLGIYELVRLFL